MTYLVVGIFCMLKGFWVVVGGGKNIGLRAMDVGTFAYGTTILLRRLEAKSQPIHGHFSKNWKWPQK